MPTTLPGPVSATQCPFRIAEKSNLPRYIGPETGGVVTVGSTGCPLTALEPPDISGIPADDELPLNLLAAIRLV